MLCRTGNTNLVKRLLASPSLAINRQEPSTKMTAAHYAALVVDFEPELVPLLFSF